MSLFAYLRAQVLVIWCYTKNIKARPHILLYNYHSDTLEVFLNKRERERRGRSRDRKLRCLCKSFLRTRQMPYCRICLRHGSTPSPFSARSTKRGKRKQHFRKPLFSNRQRKSPVSKTHTLWVLMQSKILKKLFDEKNARKNHTHENWKAF